MATCGCDSRTLYDATWHDKSTIHHGAYGGEVWVSVGRVWGEGREGVGEWEGVECK